MQRGFTVYLAVLVSSLSLAIGLAIYDLVSREVSLSQVARESQYAIYAADTGIECALFWDFHYTDADGSVFATSTEDSPGSGALCSGQAFNVVPDASASASRATTTFTVNTTSAGASGPCVTVAVGKHPTVPLTIVEARGYNTCNTGSPLRVERQLQATY